MNRCKSICKKSKSLFAILIINNDIKEMIIFVPQLKKSSSMLFFEKYGNVFIRVASILQAVIFALIPFLFIKEKLSDPSWSPGFFAYLIILLMAGGSLFFLYAALFYGRIMRKRALKDQLLKREQFRQLAAIQEERFRNPIDTTTLILLDNVTGYEQLETLLLDNMAEDEGTLENLPLLWKRGEGSYAITFPCGVSRQVLCDLVDDIGCFCSCTVQVWCKPELFKKHIGEWLYLCYGAEDLLVAITEDETQWNINPEDVMLYRSERHDRFFQPHPEIDWTRLEKMMI